MKEDIVQLEATISEQLDSKRLDQALAELFPQYSRSKLQAWIKSGDVHVDGKALRAKDKVVKDQQITVNASIIPQETWQAQNIKLNIVFEDDAILVLNKPAGLVAHPAAGNPDGTMLNALLHHDPDLAKIPRCGIIHRLDKETTGLLVVAKTLSAHTHLVAALQSRQIKREYEAIVNGVMITGGSVDAPIGRHPKDRKRMAVVTSGKPALTHYRVIKRFRTHTHIKVTLETGRTHQIRVHMAHINYQIVGDQVYGKRVILPPKASEQLKAYLQGFKRQALHAKFLGLEHPVSGKHVEWTAKLPDDMENLLSLLEQDLIVNN